MKMGLVNAVLGLSLALVPVFEVWEVDIEPRVIAAETCHDTLRVLLWNPPSATFSDATFRVSDLAVIVTGTVSTKDMTSTWWCSFRSGGMARVVVAR